MRRLSLGTSLLLVGLLALACAAGAPHARHARKHRATSILRIEPGITRPAPVDSIAFYLESPAFLSEAATHPALLAFAHLSQTADPATALRQRMSVRSVPGASLIELRTSGRTDSEARGIADAISETAVTNLQTSGISRYGETLLATRSAGSLGRNVPLILATVFGFLLGVAAVLWSLRRRSPSAVDASA